MILLFSVSDASGFGFTSGSCNISTPYDIHLSKQDLYENRPSGTFIGVLTTDDSDGVMFSYSLVSGEGDYDNGSFSISNDTLYSNAVFDYESQNTFTIRVRSTDKGGLQIENNFILLL